MAINFTRVQPGDLIIAEQWNQILQELEKLENRVSILESASNGTDGSVVIFGISPMGPYHEKDKITVVGKNFVTPAVNNIAYIDGVRVPIFLFGSDGTQLVFDIPDIPSLPEGGGTVTLAVSNQNGTASYDFNLEPELVVPTGRVEVLYTEPPIIPEAELNIVGDGEHSYVFTFSVTAFVTEDGTYNIEPQMSAVGWSADFLENDSDAVRSSNTIDIVGNVDGASSVIRIRVNVPAAANGSSADLHLVVTETSEGSEVNPGTGTVEGIMVGSPPPVPDNRVRVSLRSTTNADMVNGRVVFDRDRKGVIRFNLYFTEVGLYNFNGMFRNPAGWAVDNFSMQSLQVDNVPTNQNVSVAMAPGNAASSTDFLLEITSTSNTENPLDIKYAQGISVA